MAADFIEQPWVRLHQFLAAWRPDIDLQAYLEEAHVLGGHLAAYERQMDVINALCPPDMASETWNLVVADR